MYPEPGVSPQGRLHDRRPQAIVRKRTGSDCAVFLPPRPDPVVEFEQERGVVIRSDEAHRCHGGLPAAPGAAERIVRTAPAARGMRVLRPADRYPATGDVVP